MALCGWLKRPLPELGPTYGVSPKGLYVAPDDKVDLYKTPNQVICKLGPRPLIRHFPIRGKIRLLDNGTIFVRNVARLNVYSSAGKLLKVCDLGTNNDNDYSVSSDGQYYAILENDGSTVRRVSDDKSVAKFSGYESFGDSPTFSSDGRWATFIRANHTRIGLVRLSDGKKFLSPVFPSSVVQAKPLSGTEGKVVYVREVSVSEEKGTTMVYGEYNLVDEAPNSFEPIEFTVQWGRYMPMDRISFSLGNKALIMWGNDQGWIVKRVDFTGGIPRIRSKKIPSGGSLFVDGSGAIYFEGVWRGEDEGYLLKTSFDSNEFKRVAKIG